MRKILIGIFLILVGSALLFSYKKAPEPASPTPTMAPTQQVKNDDEQIKAVLKKEIPEKAAVKKFEVLEITYSGDYAKAIIKPLDVVTDNAFVYLQKTNNQWKLIWGPGTDIPQSDPLYPTVPKNLLP